MVGLVIMEVPGLPLLLRLYLSDEWVLAGSTCVATGEVTKLRASAPDGLGLSTPCRALLTSVHCSPRNSWR